MAMIAEDDIDGTDHGRRSCSDGWVAIVKH